MKKLPVVLCDRSFKSNVNMGNKHLAIKQNKKSKKTSDKFHFESQLQVNIITK